MTLWAKVDKSGGTPRPLRPDADAARAARNSEGEVSLGLRAEQKIFMEIFPGRGNRSFLEALLKEVSGTDWTLKFSCRGAGAGQKPSRRRSRATAQAQQRCREII